ncbi:MAG: hypothetical protein GY778_01865, partial [bacterium]|nr:hypothetical protein [bacterium]
MANSFVRLLGVELGFDADHLLAVPVRGVQGPKYVVNHGPGDWEVTPQATILHQEILERIQSLPGVESAGMTSQLPPWTPWQHAFQIAGRPSPAPGEKPLADYNEVDEEFFRTMRIPLLSGRFFERQDGQDSSGVAIISKTLARRFFPDEDPIGRVLQATFQAGWYPDPTANNRPSLDDRPRSIVGVVGDIRHRLRSDPVP